MKNLSFSLREILTWMVVLGMPYDYGIDIWSVGCTLFELYTGKILFTGRSNNQMLRAIMECRGKFSHKILRRAQFAGLHFDDLLNFRSLEKDRLSGKVGTSRLVRAFLLGGGGFLVKFRHDGANDR